MNLLTEADAATDDVLARGSVLDHEKLFGPPAAAGDARQAVREAFATFAEQIGALLAETPAAAPADQEIGAAHRAAIAADLDRLIATMNRALAEWYEPEFTIGKVDGKFALVKLRVTREY
jgi:hypothetical protein